MLHLRGVRRLRWWCHGNRTCLRFWRSDIVYLPGVHRLGSWCQERRTFLRSLILFIILRVLRASSSGLFNLVAVFILCRQMCFLCLSSVVNSMYVKLHYVRSYL